MSLYLNIEKRLGDFQLRVNLETGDDILALLGGSGCGKSLPSNWIAGMEHPDKGRIIVDGNVFFDSKKKINLSPQKRRAGLIFQNYALFPNMTVEANILCATRRDSSSATKKTAVGEGKRNHGELWNITAGAALSFSALRRPAAKGGPRQDSGVVT